MPVIFATSMYQIEVFNTTEKKAFDCLKRNKLYLKQWPFL